MCIHTHTHTHTHTLTHTHTHFHLDCKPTLAKRLAPNWSGLGDLLDFDESGTQLGVIEKRYPNDPEACCRAMFQHWLTGNGVKPCSWCKLIELLKDCDQEVLAEEVEASLTS